jgi:hypothetical protein
MLTPGFQERKDTFVWSPLGRKGPADIGNFKKSMRFATNFFNQRFA